jgi:hypothetical protein
MAELDLLIDSLLQQRNAPDVDYIEDRYAGVLQLKQTTSRGQGVFAEQFLSVKDPICTLSYPTVMAIDSDFLSTTCYYCLALTATPLPLPNYGCASMNLKICNGCSFARFCDKSCQVQAWNRYHKYECNIFRKLQHNHLPTTLRAVLRAVLLKDRGMIQIEEWDRIVQLTSHEYILAARGPSNLTDMAEAIKHLAQSSMTVEMIQRLIFIMRANAIELPTPIHGGIGVMLDPLFAKFNHSCEPNIAIHRPQYTLKSGWMSSNLLSEDERKTFARIVPLRDIQKGEELLSCYVVPTASVKERKAKLQENYFFECSCSKCVSDTEAARTLADEQPELSARFEQWSKDVKRSLSQVGQKPHAFQKAAAMMHRSERYLEDPVLYTTGDFPQLAMGLILEGLKAHASDEAIVNVLRIYCLVNPERFIGRHNPTSIYTIFLMLAMFDAVLDSSETAYLSRDKMEKCVRNLEARGLSERGLIYWQKRIRVDLRERLEDSAMQDLLSLVGEQEDKVQEIDVQHQDAAEEELKRVAEQEMRALLKLKEPRWEIVIQKNGC